MRAFMVKLPSGVRYWTVTGHPLPDKKGQVKRTLSIQQTDGRQLKGMERECQRSNG
jgi:hypothetical protein